MKFHAQDYSIYQGALILVNQQHPLQSFDFPLVSLTETILLQKEAASLLRQCLKALPQSEEIVAVSGFRSHDEQARLYQSSLEENGKEYTEKFVALPDTSEHQTGLAIDLAIRQEEIDFICPEFPRFGVAQKFRDIMGNYGFIERYAQEKKHLTRIEEEPWHFRYVGYPHSLLIRQHHFCLEEYIEYLQGFTLNHPLLFEHQHHHFTIFTIEKEAEFEVENKTIVQVSGNNCGQLVVTLWQQR